MNGGEQQAWRLQVPLSIAPGKPTLQISTSVAPLGVLPRSPLRSSSMPSTRADGQVQLEMAMSTLESEWSLIGQQFGQAA
jgi:hypothetical protein